MAIVEIVFNCLYNVAILAANLVLIVRILSRRDLRCNSKYILVLALAVTDLYPAVFLLPVSTHTLMTAISPSCTVIKALQGSAFITTMIASFGIIVIHLDSILQISMTSYKGRLRNVITIIFICFFIQMPLIILIPMFVNGTTDIISCKLSLSYSYAKAALVVSYWLPAVVMFVTSIFVIVKYRNARRQLALQRFYPHQQQQGQYNGQFIQPQNTTFQGQPQQQQQQQYVNPQTQYQTNYNQQPGNQQLFPGNQTPNQQFPGNQIPNQQFQGNQEPSQQFQGNQPQNQQFQGNQPQNQQFQGNQPQNQQFQGNQPQNQQFQGNQLHLAGTSGGFQLSSSQALVGTQFHQAVSPDINNTDLLMAAILTICLNLPEQIVSLITFSCFFGCTWLFTLYEAVSYISLTRPIFMPLIWMASPMFRRVTKGHAGTVISTPRTVPSVAPPPYYQTTPTLNESESNFQDGVGSVSKS